MRIQWYGQSAFALSSRDASVFVDPFGDMSPARDRGMQWDYPAIEGVDAQLLLVTHEHLDHNAVEVIGGDPAILRSTAGKLESPVGEVVAVASEHDQAAGTERGPNTIFVFSLDGLRVGALRRLRPGRAARRAGGGDRRGRPDLLPVGGGPTVDAAQAREIVDRLRPKWVVPMHYRTPKIGFLEPADAFMEKFDEVHRCAEPSFETADLASAEQPVVVVPAVP